MPGPGPYSPLDDPNYNCLDSNVLRKIADLADALQQIESDVNQATDGQLVMLSGDVTLQGEGFIYGYLRATDDWWSFVPDIKEDE